MSKDAGADDEKAKTYEEFQAVANMTPAALEKWLESEDSRSVGWADGKNKTQAGGKEAVGHASGRAIVAIKRKKKSDLDEDDYAQMKKVIGYVHRHLAQKPKGDSEHSRWRFSLMNWGHDPGRD